MISLTHSNKLAEVFDSLNDNTISKGDNLRINLDEVFDSLNDHTMSKGDNLRIDLDGDSLRINRDLQQIIGMYLVGDEFDEPIEILASKYIDNESYIFLNNVNVRWTPSCVKKLIKTRNKELIQFSFPKDQYKDLSLFTINQEVYEVGLQFGFTPTINCLIEAIRNDCDLEFFKKLYDNFEKKNIDRIIEICISKSNVEILNYVFQKEGILTLNPSNNYILDTNNIYIWLFMYDTNAEIKRFLYNNTQIKYNPNIRHELMTIIINSIPEYASEFMTMYPEVVNEAILSQACCSNNISIVKYILELKPYFIDYINDDNTPEDICNVANEEMIRFLDDQGVNFTSESIINCFKNNQHEVAFFLYDKLDYVSLYPSFPGEMANAGYLNVLKWIHENDITEIQWIDCLTNSIDGNHSECTTWILDTMQNVELANLQEVFDIACENGKLDGVIQLHERYSLLASEPHFIVAAAEGQLDIIKFLTSKGQPVCTDESPLEEAITYHHKDTIEWFCKNRLSDKDPEISSINYLIQSNICSEESLVLLLDERAPYKINSSAVRHVIQTNKVNILKFIIDNQPEILKPEYLKDCRTKACLRLILKSKLFTFDQLRYINHNNLQLAIIIQTYIKTYKSIGY
jgi:hypothetical protein